MRKVLVHYRCKYRKHLISHREPTSCTPRFVMEETVDSGIELLTRAAFSDGVRIRTHLLHRIVLSPGTRSLGPKYPLETLCR